MTQELTHDQRIRRKALMGIGLSIIAIILAFTLLV